MTIPANLHSPSIEAGAIDSRRLQVFLAAAKTGSFAAAAERLAITPSAVSHAIKALEEEFDCNLFKRHGPKVTMTRAGIRLMPLAEELLARMARLRQEVAAIQGNPRSMRVLMPECFTSMWLPRILPDFMECFPLAFFEPVPGNADEDASMDALVEGEIDLLITYNGRGGREVVRRDLFHESLQVYAAPFHSLARTPRLDAAALEPYPMAVASETLFRLANDRLFARGATKPRLWPLTSVESARELARTGQATALLPSRLVLRAARQGHLIPLPLEVAGLQWTCSIFWSARVELSWAAEVFISLAEMVVQETVEAS